METHENSIIQRPAVRFLPRWGHEDNFTVRVAFENGCQKSSLIVEQLRTGVVILYLIFDQKLIIMFLEWATGKINGEVTNLRQVLDRFVKVYSEACFHEHFLMTMQ